MTPPREPSAKLVGHVRMAAYLKFFVEFAAYKKMVSKGVTDIK